MKAFKEFLLEDTCNEQNIYLPAGAEIVDISSTDIGVALIAITASSGYGTSGIPEMRTFKICEKDEIFTGNIVKYLGSYKSLLGTKYVIEVKREF